VAVVPFDAEPTHCLAARRDCEASRPADRIPIERDAARRRVERPPEIDTLIGAHHLRCAGERIVVEVLALEPAFDLAVGGERELFGGHDGVLAARSARAWLVAHGTRRSQPLANAIDDRYRMDARPRIAAKPDFRGVDADHGERASAGR